MAAGVYCLCALISAACALLLFDTFWRHRLRSARLMLWTGCSFAGFAVSNGLVVADLVMLRTAELAVARAATACIAGGLLLFGLIWEAH